MNNLIKQRKLRAITGEYYRLEKISQGTSISVDTSSKEFNLLLLVNRYHSWRKILLCPKCYTRVRWYDFKPTKVRKDGKFLWQVICKKKHIVFYLECCVGEKI